MSGHAPVAIVTGAGGAIGGAICRTLANRSGHLVVATFRPGGNAPTVAAPGLTVQPLDVRDGGAVAELVDRVMREHGRIDVLVNNAGVCRWGDPDAWRHTFDVNLFGAVELSHAVTAPMRRRGAGSIVNISSQAARVPERGNAAYCAAKAALVMFTRVCALELADSGVRVNAVSPGPVDTAMLRRSARTAAQAAGCTEAEVLAGYAASTAARRLLAPEEIAAAVEFLISDAASGITGADIPVTLGATTW
ncbi:SDR family NAD(P)-dependent oxidoreductase [Micromonospora okii]|uniref:SDR family NAD(P)-dependent oxidoreductase n=1 Tax=Micromonospora okii TaxID=1182970 RepID=UPI001E2E78D9|nr:SDR family oxidoreductase [Micromonospora okii]